LCGCPGNWSKELERAVREGLGHRKEPDHRVRGYWRAGGDIGLAESALVDEAVAGGADRHDAGDRAGVYGLEHGGIDRPETARLHGQDTRLRRLGATGAEIGGGSQEAATRQDVSATEFVHRSTLARTGTDKWPGNCLLRIGAMQES